MTKNIVPRINEKRMDMLRWHIALFDVRRSSLENRAAITVSITAVLFGGYVLLFQEAISGLLLFSSYQDKLLPVLILITVFLLALSLAMSTMAIANVHKTSHQMHGLEMPKRLFFYPRETFAILKDFKSYQDYYMSATNREMFSYMLGELWVISKEYQTRYSHLRLAIRLLLASTVSILASLIILLMRY